MSKSAVKRFLIKQYECCYEIKRVFHLRLMYRLRIMNPDRTIAYIEKNHCSIARFGDGEFDLLLGVRGQSFQTISDSLAKELENVMENRDKNLLICVPRCLNTTLGCNKHAKSFWIEWGKNGHQQQIVGFIRKHTGYKYRFGDSLITRPYIDWIDERAPRLFQGLKRLWDGKDIMIVEGSQTRLGIGNDIFENVNSIRRIICPSTNAFEKKTEIEEAILNNYSNEIVLLALGPTATIIASDLTEKGIQALDIGHIDIEYEWFLRGAKERIPIPGKYTNEAKEGTGRVWSECKDETYLRQIIACIEEN